MSDPTDSPLPAADVGPIAAGDEETGAIQIPIAGQLTRQDLLSAYRLHLKPTPLALAGRIAFLAPSTSFTY